MQRLPVDGKKVVEHRITLGTFERNMLQDIATSYRVQAIDPEAMFKILEDPLRIVQIAYGIATTLELIGFETGLPTPGDLPELYQWFTTRDTMGQKARESGQKPIIDILKEFLSGTGDFEGTWPGGY
jgi:hypothetical protein